MLVEGLTLSTEGLALFEAMKFLVEYASGKVLDDFSSGVLEKTAEKSVEAHAYEVLYRSYADFCDKYNVEVNESSFKGYLLQYQSVGRLDDRDFLRSFIEKITALELNEDQLMEWLRIVREHIVSDEHQKLYRAITFKRLCEHEENLSEVKWVDDALLGNSLEIGDLAECSIEELHKSIKTSLSNDCWSFTASLLYELVRNAQEHGKALKVSLIIKEDEITIIDDGMHFDIFHYEQQDVRKGRGNGLATLKAYSEEYPEVKIQYCRLNYQNRVDFSFPEKVFNVNGLCELIIRGNYRKIEVFQVFEPGRAKMYYIDFAKLGRGFFAPSMVADYVQELKNFAINKNAYVNIGIPKEDPNSTGWASWNSVADRTWRRIIGYAAADLLDVVRY